MKAEKLLKQEGKFTAANCHDKAFASGIRRMCGSSDGLDLQPPL